jgi:hypothetical protein
MHLRDNLTRCTDTSYAIPTQYATLKGMVRRGPKSVGYNLLHNPLGRWLVLGAQT